MRLQVNEIVKAKSAHKVMFGVIVQSSASFEIARISTDAFQNGANDSVLVGHPVNGKLFLANTNSILQAYDTKITDIFPRVEIHRILAHETDVGLHNM